MLTFGIIFVVIRVVFGPEPQTMLILAAFLLLCKLVAYLRTAHLQLYYPKENSLFKEFVEKSDISKMTFEPNIFAPNSLFQAVFFLFKEVTI